VRLDDDQLITVQLGRMPGANEPGGGHLQILRVIDTNYHLNQLPVRGPLENQLAAAIDGQEPAGRVGIQAKLGVVVGYRARMGHAYGELGQTVQTHRSWT
jgi:hypothetical protein